MAVPRVVVVDHDAAFLEMMQALLADEGYQASSCLTADTALPLIKRERPDLVLLDTWVETRTAGWELLTRLRLDPDTADIPILVCSSDGQSLRDQIAQLAVQQVELLEKPFHLDALLGQLTSLVGPPQATQSPELLTAH